MENEAEDEKIEQLRQDLERCAFRLHVLDVCSSVALFTTAMFVGYAVTVPGPAALLGPVALAAFWGMQASRYLLAGRRQALRAQLSAAMRRRSPW